MALENLVAYAVLLGLPLWLVAEEIVHRFVSRSRRPKAAGGAVKDSAPAERRAPERAHAHASSV
jgi:hypothetical protein